MTAVVLAFGVALTAVLTVGIAFARLVGCRTADLHADPISDR